MEKTRGGNLRWERRGETWTHAADVRAAQLRFSGKVSLSKWSICQLLDPKAAPASDSAPRHWSVDPRIPVVSQRPGRKLQRSATGNCQLLSCQAPVRVRSPSTNVTGARR